MYPGNELTKTLFLVMRTMQLVTGFHWRRQSPQMTMMAMLQPFQQRMRRLKTLITILKRRFLPEKHLKTTLKLTWKVTKILWLI